jgi:hypothetical protein
MMPSEYVGCKPWLDGYFLSYSVPGISGFTTLPLARNSALCHLIAYRQLDDRALSKIEHGELLAGHA